MKISTMGPALALAALVSAQGAQAQQACVAPQDLSDTVTYALPILYDSLQSPCQQQFAASSFMQAQGPAFIDRFRARQDAAWPGTMRLLKTFMTRSTDGKDAADAEMMALITSLPEESLRPFVDGIVGQMINEKVASDIKPQTCSDIAEAMELIEPLPAENVGGLVTFIARQADIKDPQICSSN